MDPMLSIDRHTDSDVADSVYDALSNRHRRATLRFLGDRRQPATVSALVDALVESDRDALDQSTEAREHLRIALTHSHLPKLADAGLVEWDRERGLVSRSSQIEERTVTVPFPAVDCVPKRTE